jgi:hypothetical protein
VSSGERFDAIVIGAGLVARPRSGGCSGPGCGSRWAVAPLAGDWIHYAALAIKTRIPVSTLIDTVAQFATYTEAHLTALEQACG